MVRYGLEYLNNKERALICFALLLDGQEALAYLENDPSYSRKLKEPLTRIAELQADIRIPYVGSLLRRALNELE
jgi:hypothetical protein